MSLIQFPFTPDKVDFQQISDFLLETVEDELYRELRFNKLRNFAGENKAYGTVIQVRQTVTASELKDFNSYYFLMKGRKKYFTLPESFWRNINKPAFINELPNLGVFWVFKDKPSIRTVVSGIYELTYQLETVAEDSIVNKSSFDKTLAPGSGAQIRFSVPTLSPEIASRVIKTVPISAKFEVVAPILDFSQGSNPSSAPSILFSAPELTSLAVKVSNVTSPSVKLGTPSLGFLTGQNCVSWDHGSEEFKAICTFNSSTFQIPEHFGKWLEFNTAVENYQYILSANPERGFHVHLVNTGINNLIITPNTGVTTTLIGNPVIPSLGKALLVNKDETTWFIAEFGGSLLSVADGTKTLPDSTPYLSINETDKEIAVDQPSDEELPQLAANDRDLAVTSRWRAKPITVATEIINPNLGMSFVCSDSSLTAIAIDIAQTYSDGQVFELELTGGAAIDEANGGFNFGASSPPSGACIISCRYSEALSRWLCSGAGGY